MTFPPLDSTVLVTESERDTRWFFQNLVRQIATGQQTGGAFAMFEVLAPPGDETPLHMHTNEDEFFLMIEGQVTLWAGDEMRVLEAGDFGGMPRMVPHCYKVTSAVDGRWLVITSPAGFEGFMHDASVPAPEARIPDPFEPDAEAMGALMAVAAKYGVEFLGGPGSRPSDLKKG
jgi:uncharacterized cupin superfamily protein